MDYKLFEEYITLQALFKKLSFIQSGGNIKSYLQDTTVLFNGEDEKRRGKKLRIGDIISIPEKNLTITIIKPSAQEVSEYQEEQNEKKRVDALVKELNKKQKVQQPKKAIRFPGT